MGRWGWRLLGAGLALSGQACAATAAVRACWLPESGAPSAPVRLFMMPANWNCSVEHVRWYRTADEVARDEEAAREQEAAVRFHAQRLDPPPAVAEVGSSPRPLTAVVFARVYGLEGRELQEESAMLDDLITGCFGDWCEANGRAYEDLVALYAEQVRRARTNPSLDRARVDQFVARVLAAAKKRTSYFGEHCPTSTHRQGLQLGLATVFALADQPEASLREAEALAATTPPSADSLAAWYVVGHVRFLFLHDSEGARRAFAEAAKSAAPTVQQAAGEMLRALDSPTPAAK